MKQTLLALSPVLVIGGIMAAAIAVAEHKNTHRSILWRLDDLEKNVKENERLCEKRLKRHEKNNRHEWKTNKSVY